MATKEKQTEVTLDLRLTVKFKNGSPVSLYTVEKSLARILTNRPDIIGRLGDAISTDSPDNPVEETFLGVKKISQNLKRKA